LLFVLYAEFSAAGGGRTVIYFHGFQIFHYVICTVFVPENSVFGNRIESLVESFFSDLV